MLMGRMRKQRKDCSVCYEIMHMDRMIARINTDGLAEIIDEMFFPYNLWLEEGDDLDTRIHNLNVFYHWCALRVLSPDRKYAKEIMNSLGVSQSVTDQNRAQIALSYRCVSLTDVFWVRKQGECISFEQINLYENPLKEELVELSLRGRQITVTNQEIAQDLSTKGCFPKAWVRRSDGLWLLKDGGIDAVKRELIASRICQCFDFPQVVYRKSFYDGEPVTESRLVTSRRYSMVSKMAFDVYACNQELDTLEVCRELDPITYYGMNIIDYLVGNTDRHPENWGFLVDNQTNECVSLYPLMDFNQSFFSYDSIHGAVCQTVLPERKTQRQAAIEAVQQIGLRQIAEFPDDLFDEAPEWEEMFIKRHKLLTIEHMFGKMKEDDTYKEVR